MRNNLQFQNKVPFNLQWDYQKVPIIEHKIYSSNSQWFSINQTAQDNKFTKEYWNSYIQKHMTTVKVKKDSWIGAVKNTLIMKKKCFKKDHSNCFCVLVKKYKDLTAESKFSSKKKSKLMMKH